MVFDPDDKDKDASGYKSPKASVDNDPNPWGPFNKHRIPLDDYHTCPCCEGKGFVQIVKETNPNQPRRKPRDILGKLID